MQGCRRSLRLAVVEWCLLPRLSRARVPDRPGRRAWHCRRCSLWLLSSVFPAARIDQCRRRPSPLPEPSPVRVTDSTGAVLPGVAIEISSDALMGARTDDHQRRRVAIRFPVVPPGDVFARVQRVRVSAPSGATPFTSASGSPRPWTPSSVWPRCDHHVAVERGASPIDGRVHRDHEPASMPASSRTSPVPEASLQSWPRRQPST